MRLILVPESHASVISLDLVSIAVIHIDNDRTLERDGIADVEAVGGTARYWLAALECTPEHDQTQ